MLHFGYQNGNRPIDLLRMQINTAYRTDIVRVYLQQKPRVTRNDATLNSQNTRRGTLNFMNNFRNSKKNCKQKVRLMIPQLFASIDAAFSFLGSYLKVDPNVNVKPAWGKYELFTYP